MVCQTRPEINVKEAVGMYDFTVVPRAFFAAEGSMLHCPNKSALMSLLEKEKPVSNEPVVPQVTRRKVDIVDGMAALQSLDKRATIRPVRISLSIFLTPFSKSMKTATSCI